MHEEILFVFVIDDNRSIRESLSNLIRSARLNVQTFASAQAFLTSRRRDAPSCLVIDVQLPGFSGLELQQELAKGDDQISIIIITGRGDLPMTVRAMKAGATEFLTKPCRNDDLLNAIEQATHRSRQLAPGQHLPADGPPYAAEELCRDSSGSAIVGHSTALCRVLTAVETVAPTDATVLLSGETGTGADRVVQLGGTAAGMIQVATTRTRLEAYLLTLAEERCFMQLVTVAEGLTFFFSIAVILYLWIQ